ncbi:hypothetical protein K0M31_014938 [Melipona bicolor]|uniref:Uncharacterized protein n=1 Tax=Melipona bicolor TaxID=60889 RepID=A0AA40FGK1_9HYME|nr:hypothetical protein K0M31_014938 [Melipona bicolor]
MRPLSFENLRRLVGRKKDRNEPSFKRSESFKRISIRKSYLDRGKRRNKLQKSLESPAVDARSVQVDANSKPTIEKQAVIKEQKSKKLQDDTLSRESISYDEWLQGVSSSSREKLDELHREQQQNKQNRQQQQQHFAPARNNQVAKFQRQNEADHVAEELKVLELDASPVLPSKSHRISNETITIRNEEKNGHQDVVLQETKSVEGPPPSVSVNLGRIWRDAVPMSFPATSGPSIHHSLDSALKERKPQPTVARTVSAPEKSVAGKDVSSAFGFSLRIARLADFRPGLLSTRTTRCVLIDHRRR